MKRARCVLFEDDNFRRCRRRAARAMEDLYVCSGHHGLLTIAMMADATSATTRRMLAFSVWETYAEGRALIDRRRRRVA